jgi:hypothetical protein
MADLRKCIGSTRFGIEAHEAPVGDFPAQPSQKDGLGRMCKPHWNQYTAGLARDAKARRLATTNAEAAEPAAAAVKPRKSNGKAPEDAGSTEVGAAQVSRTLFSGRGRGPGAFLRG